MDLEQEEAGGDERGVYEKQKKGGPTGPCGKSKERPTASSPKSDKAPLEKDTG